MGRSGKADAGGSSVLAQFTTVHGLPQPLSLRSQLFAKRVIDIGGSIFLASFLVPVLIGLALAVRLTSPGPAIFHQRREGQGGRIFTAYKLRTVYLHHEDPTGLRQATPDDIRVTRLGRFLRRSGLDELPQLFNVLRGDMSLVGPRPHVPGMIAAGQPYRDLVPDYDERHAMRPGITGWAQVQGFRGATVDETAARGRTECDLYYVRNFSLLFDAKILLLTLWVGFRSGY